MVRLAKLYEFFLPTWTITLKISITAGRLLMCERVIYTIKIDKISFISKTTHIHKSVRKISVYERQYMFRINVSSKPGVTV